MEITTLTTFLATIPSYIFVFLVIIIIYTFFAYRYYLLMNYNKKVVNYYYNRIVDQRERINQKASQKKWDNESDFTEEFTEMIRLMNDMKKAPRAKDLMFKFDKWSFKQCYPDIK